MGEILEDDKGESSASSVLEEGLKLIEQGN